MEGLIWKKNSAFYMIFLFVNRFILHCSWRNTLIHLVFTISHSRVKATVLNLFGRTGPPAYVLKSWGCLTPHPPPHPKWPKIYSLFFALNVVFYFLPWARICSTSVRSKWSFSLLLRVANATWQSSSSSSSFYFSLSNCSCLVLCVCVFTT